MYSSPLVIADSSSVLEISIIIRAKRFMFLVNVIIRNYGTKLSSTGHSPSFLRESLFQKKRKREKKEM